MLHDRQYPPVSTHSRLKAAGADAGLFCAFAQVSTHSRLKAAGEFAACLHLGNCSFNTQPPEGGWQVICQKRCLLLCFNTQPPEGGWLMAAAILLEHQGFNTQPPEGGWVSIFGFFLYFCCFNTQPPEGGWFECDNAHRPNRVSTHSRLKAAG